MRAMREQLPNQKGRPLESAPLIGGQQHQTRRRPRSIEPIDLTRSFSAVCS